MCSPLLNSGISPNRWKLPVKSLSLVAVASDTIVARATAPGLGGIGVVRLSGREAPRIAAAILGTVPAPRLAKFAAFKDAQGEPIDMGIALYFQAPHSFTGEEVIEFQGHGGPAVLDLLVTRCVELGARLARPGEFSERAFLNEKMDLVQAEAVADLIAAQSHAAARGALRSLQGLFSKRVQALQASLSQLRVYIEAALDFPEEEIDFISDSAVTEQLQQLEEDFAQLLLHAHQGAKMRDGIKLVLLGRPNVGKSSLLNALAERESAIVTDIPGTTRDLLNEAILLDGLPLHIVDTAGLHDTNDPIEQEGMKRAQEVAAEADHILLIVDDERGFNTEDETLLNHYSSAVPVTLLFNKIDLTNRKPGEVEDLGYPAVAISVTSSLGLDALKSHLLRSAGMNHQNESPFIARQRHLLALQQAQSCLIYGSQQLQQHRAAELLAEDLRQAQKWLSEITGELHSDDLLGQIFSSFCIGK
ncbi:MAG TPA: tRNA uridine-5-carboxymethylaminomethyl(34) synthesis GTPase MnmE [Gammaproteobacteria bacterium]|nr:tRNA uridine-5-carboxymethylaminomethyl(34) synthesis GTPase MnmE [Gammaproteobacteria bacterium]